MCLVFSSFLSLSDGTIPCILNTAKGPLPTGGGPFAVGCALTFDTVTRRYRGAVYHIAVDNTAAVQHGVQSITVDGKALAGNVLPLAAVGTTVQVQVTMG